MKSIKKYLTPVFGVIGFISRVINVEAGMRWILNRGRSGYHTQNTSDNCARCSRRLRKLNDDDKGEAHENLAADQFYTSHQKHYRLRGGAGHGPTAPTNQQTHSQPNDTYVHIPGPEEGSRTDRGLELALELAMSEINVANMSAHQNLFALREAISQHYLMFTFNEDELEFPVNHLQFRLVMDIQKLKTKIVSTLKGIFLMASHSVAPILPAWAQNLPRSASRDWATLENILMDGPEILNFRRMYGDGQDTFIIDDFHSMNRVTAQNMVSAAHNSLQLVLRSLDLVHIIMHHITYVVKRLTNEQTHNAEQTHNNE
ncbi:hypothetical protein K3495_g13923 [Podosphaera aphanis]|nr:hypothetical protein K3495_g13923 [Podosphaera aphanis]